MTWGRRCGCRASLPHRVDPRRHPAHGRTRSRTRSPTHRLSVLPGRRARNTAAPGRRVCPQMMACSVKGRPVAIALGRQVRQVDAAPLAVQQPLGHAAADAGRMLQPMAREAAGQHQVVAVRVRTHQAVVVQRVHLVVAVPCALHAQRLEGRHPRGQRRPHAVFKLRQVGLVQGQVVRVGLARAGRPAGQEARALAAKPHARACIHHQRRGGQRRGAAQHEDGAPAGGHPAPARPAPGPARPTRRLRPARRPGPAACCRRPAAARPGGPGPGPACHCPPTTCARRVATPSDRALAARARARASPSNQPSPSSPRVAACRSCVASQGRRCARACRSSASTRAPSACCSRALRASTSAPWALSARNR